MLVFFFKHQADVSSTGIDLHASVQTLLLLLSLLLLLPLCFLLSFLIVVLLFQLLSANTVVNPFEHPRRFFFLISFLSSRCFSTRESAISAAAHSHLGGDLTSWLAPFIGGKCKFCWESSGSRTESGRSLPSLVGTVHRLQMLIASGKQVVTKKRCIELDVIYRPKRAYDTSS